MMAAAKHDAIVVGSGPNGLAAAITLARAGLSVRLYEAAPEPGGGARSGEVTLPHFVHDICSAIHPLAAASPLFRSLSLEKYGLEWITPPAMLAHPLDGGRAVAVPNDISQVSGELLEADDGSYRSLFEPLLPLTHELFEQILGPFKIPLRHPLLLARFGIHALLPASMLIRRRFRSAPARALFAGAAAHSNLALDALTTAATAIVLLLAGHSIGWPLPRGGSRAITRALLGCFESFGGEVTLATPVTRFDELPKARLYLFDLSPHSFLSIFEGRLPPSYRKRLRSFRYGPGVFKMDFALSRPVPWTAASASHSATLHLGGSFEEISASESEVAKGGHPDFPFVLAAQPSLFDSSRAPDGKHTLWAYCHVPNGSEADMSPGIEAQIERFAPGFRDCILAKRSMGPRDFERYNANYRGGDIGGGSMDWGQLFTRPAGLFHPYDTPIDGVYLCSASTPPGPGVHGMCGYHAALRALGRLVPLNIPIR